MPKKKGSKKGAGRPKGEYSTLTKAEKTEYHTIAVRASRAGDDEAECNSTHVSIDAANAFESEDDNPLTSPRGRPPIGESALTPNSRKKRQCATMATLRKKAGIVKKRRIAAMARWSQPESEESDSAPAEEERESDSIPAEEEPVPLPDSDVEMDGNEDKQVTERRISLKLRLLASCQAIS